MNLESGEGGVEKPTREQLGTLAEKLKGFGLDKEWIRRTATFQNLGGLAIGEELKHDFVDEGIFLKITRTADGFDVEEYNNPSP